MKRTAGFVFFVVIALLALDECAAANNAPAVLPTCLVIYTFSAAWQSSVRVVLYESSGAYTEISVSGASLASSGAGATLPPSTTTAPHHGVYSYRVDPQNSGHASIVYDGGGAGALPNDELYFVTATAGSRQPPDSLSFASDSFRMFPMQSNAGATNFSTRTTLTAGGEAIAGFVIGGTKTTWVLVRAVGAGLASFGVSPTATQPAFTVYDKDQTVVGSSSRWGADPNLVPGYNAIAARVGAFPLSETSDEGVLVAPLAPGTYTVAFRASTGGQILCETYILPFAAEIP